jgi:hypothetical protein
MVENMILLLIGLWIMCALMLVGEVLAKYFDWE